MKNLELPSPPVPVYGSSPIRPLLYEAYQFIKTKQYLDKLICELYMLPPRKTGTLRSSLDGFSKVRS